MSDIVQKTTPNSGLTSPSKGKIGIPGLHARLASPLASNNLDAATLPNRLALLLDTSGSMNGHKIQSLQDAMQSFVNACDFTNTAIAVQTFGGDDDHIGRLPLTVFHPILMTTIAALRASDSTPMADAMAYALRAYSLTRCVLVSDGEPDSVDRAYEAAHEMREAGLPCDCVHIGNSHSGEQCLRQIAEITGGCYVKFTDVSQFAKQFKYLTPAFYGQLTSGQLQIGDK